MPNPPSAADLGASAQRLIRWAEVARGAVSERHGALASLHAKIAGLQTNVTANSSMAAVGQLLHDPSVWSGDGAERWRTEYSLTTHPLLASIQSTLAAAAEHSANLVAETANWREALSQFISACHASTTDPAMLEGLRAHRDEYMYRLERELGLRVR
jgi:histidine ammonia-lyase